MSHYPSYKLIATSRGMLYGEAVVMDALLWNIWQLSRSQEQWNVIGHVPAGTPTGQTFLITCEVYPLLLSIQSPFFMQALSFCLHRPSGKSSKLTFIWESLYPLDCAIHLHHMWLPSHPTSPCLMEVILTAKEAYKDNVWCISNETVWLVNACWLWLQVLYVQDILILDNTFNKSLYSGAASLETNLLFPAQPKPPTWA